MFRSGYIYERPIIAFGHIVLLLTFELKGSSSDLVTCIGTGRKRREREGERGGERDCNLICESLSVLQIQIAITHAVQMQVRHTHKLRMQKQTWDCCVCMFISPALQILGKRLLQFLYRCFVTNDLAQSC